MYAQELIEALQRLVAEHGDCRVFDTIRDEVDEVEYEDGSDAFFIN